MSSPPSDAVVVMDRFVSASSSQDAVEGLQALVDAFKRGSPRDNGETLIWEPSWVLEHEDMADHLIWLLQRGTLKANEIPCEDGVNLVCQLYQHLVKTSAALKTPTPGVLLESLLDALDHSENPIYVRVLSLKVLEELSRRHKSIAGNQWLQAPNGLHRLADILAVDVEANPLEEAVRDQALIVAKLLAKEAPMAKVFLFAEVECKLLDLCWSQGGLTKGNPIVIDALELIQELLKHADASLQDLVWQRPQVAPRLTQLLDLRGGDEFLHPKPKKTSEKRVKSSDDDDDLDTLLASGDTKKKEQKNDTEEEAPVPPHLLPSEEQVVKLVLNILRLLMETESLKHIIWKQHVGLCSLVWELALINPSIPPVCALPSPALQQEALGLVAEKFDDEETMSRHSGLDRLLFLVCTGGGIAEQFDEKLGISQSALAVLRHNLSGDTIHDIMMRTIAPPPTIDEDAPPPGPTVVQKLWNTVQENLSAENSDRRTLFMSGALGGLSLMLCDEQSREIMSRITPISLDLLLESLFSENEEFVKCSMLRFLCEWTFECPLIAHNLLSSTASTHLAGMAANKSSCQSLVHLLLGLAMENLTKEEDCGGWTRAGILQIITKIGISKFTSSLESLKTRDNLKMPWTVSDMEYKSWKAFSNQAVLVVRKRVVEELSGGTGDDDSGDENDGSAGSGNASSNSQVVKPLQKLISQQAKEMEELRRELEVAKSKVAVQEDQLDTWKRRMESTPTDLDNMLNDFTAKNGKLEEKVHILESDLKRLKADKEESDKKFQEKLSQSQNETEQFRNQEREARDELEQVRSEMEALSQAYASLEEDYQRNQNSQGIGAPTGEMSQEQHGEVSHQHTAAGSTEVATLRAENARLRNDARAADDWMAMAVQKMNEMGASNVELQQQVASLNGQLQEAKTSAHEGINESSRLHLESELDHVKMALKNAEDQLSHFHSLQTDLVNERSRSAQLERQMGDAETQLENEKERSSQLEKLVAESRQDATQLEDALENERQIRTGLERRVQEVEENLRSTVSLLERERKERAEIQNQVENNTPARDEGLKVQDSESNYRLEKLQAEHDAAIASKDAEIDALKLSLKTAQEQYNNIDDKTLIEQLESARREVDEIRQNSQQDIYRLESVIRELNDRLGSGLGAYKVEDIRSRDEEIEELRRANEAAQDWMAKAVEHHQMNAAQIARLSEEKAALSLQLEQAQLSSSLEGDSARVKSLERDLVEKTQDLDAVRQRLAAIEVEFDALKKEKEANQGLLDELGIAMEDVGVMQQKLDDSENIRKELESKLAGNALNEENEALRNEKEQLEVSYNELQAWTEMAQSKISEIMSAKDELESQLQEARLQIQLAGNQKEALEASSPEVAGGSDELIELKEAVEKLDHAKTDLRNEKAMLENEREDLRSKLSTMETQLAEVQANLEEGKELHENLKSEIDDLKSKNQDLSSVLDETRTTLEAAKGSERHGEDSGSEELLAKVNNLTEALRGKEEELKSLNDVLTESEDVVQKWQGKRKRGHLIPVAWTATEAHSNFLVVC